MMNHQRKGLRAGQNRQTGQSGGRGRNRGGALGPGGTCVCTRCGERIPHDRGIKCTTIKCPGCGHTMIREELLSKENRKI